MSISHGAESVDLDHRYEHASCQVTYVVCCNHIACYTCHPFTSPLVLSDLHRRSRCERAGPRRCLDRSEWHPSPTHAIITISHQQTKGTSCSLHVHHQCIPHTSRCTSLDANSTRSSQCHGRLAYVSIPIRDHSSIERAVAFYEQTFATPTTYTSHVAKEAKWEAAMKKGTSYRMVDAERFVEGKAWRRVGAWHVCDMMA